MLWFDVLGFSYGSVLLWFSFLTSEFVRVVIYAIDKNSRNLRANSTDLIYSAVFID